VESTRAYGDGLLGPIVAEVRAIRPHPARDNLQLVTLFDGQQEQEVVCGASNVPAAGGLVAFAPLGTMPLTGRVPWFSDIVNVFHPIRALSHAAALGGGHALWNPHSACGLPFLADPNSGFAYPPNWLLDRMDPVNAVAVDIVLHLFLAGALTSAAARVRGAGRLASTLAGTTLAMCGVVFMQIQSPGNLRSIAWTPALLLGPLTVEPAVRSQGVGEIRIKHSLDAARTAGHGLVLLVGDEDYYERMGFRRVAPRGKIAMPGPVDPGRLLYCELREGAYAATSGKMLRA
jgi:GNAT superfamily N-acetyltransferase